MKNVICFSLLILAAVALGACKNRNQVCCGAKGGITEYVAVPYSVAK